MLWTLDSSKTQSLKRSCKRHSPRTYQQAVRRDLVPLILTRNYQRQQKRLSTRRVTPRAAGMQRDHNRSKHRQRPSPQVSLELRGHSDNRVQPGSRKKSSKQICAARFADTAPKATHSGSKVACPSTCAPSIGQRLSISTAISLAARASSVTGPTTCGNIRWRKITGVRKTWSRRPVLPARLPLSRLLLGQGGRAREKRWRTIMSSSTP